MITKIGEICEEVPCIEAHTKSIEAHALFKKYSKLQGIVIKAGERPIALVMRTLFYQKIGDQYGYNLYMGRPIELVMNRSPLIVDYEEPIVNVSQIAMERPEEELYDYVIVTRNNHYLGIVSIQHLLLTFANIQSERARFMNPLTGLPGNNLINYELNKLLQIDRFSVLYVDLDNFKAFNDAYGFKLGDDLILGTAEILKNNLQGFFVGHIGGDDFFASFNHYDYEKICQRIITDFHKMIKYFYTNNHWKQQYVLVENRSGIKERIPLVSVSIAVVTNEEQSFQTTEDIVDQAALVKRACKRKIGSCLLVNKGNHKLLTRHV